jgi:hypothetical protein
VGEEVVHLPRTGQIWLAGGEADQVAIAGSLESSPKGGPEERVGAGNKDPRVPVQ